MYLDSCQRSSASGWLSVTARHSSICLMPDIFKLIYFSIPNLTCNNSISHPMSLLICLLFCTISGSAQSILLYFCSELTPGDSQGTWNASSNWTRLFLPFSYFSRPTFYGLYCIPQIICSISKKIISECELYLN